MPPETAQGFVPPGAEGVGPASGIGEGGLGYGGGFGYGTQAPYPPMDVPDTAIYLPGQGMEFTAPGPLILIRKIIPCRWTTDGQCVDTG